MPERGRTYSVLQVVDSLEKLGGTEVFAVNLANLLHERGHDVRLCVVRGREAVSERLLPDVPTLYLDKKRGFDPVAPYRLFRFVKKHGVEVLHAHGGGYSTCVKAKVWTKAKFVWHDHHGKLNDLGQRPVKKLRRYAPRFDYAASVNVKLRDWAREALGVPEGRSRYLPNFTALEVEGAELSGPLPGAEGRRIVTVANLHYPKDHPTLLKAFASVSGRHPDWSLLLVGRDEGDEYANGLREFVRENRLGERVHFLGQRSDVAGILRRCDVGVLPSEAEAGQLVLLEYGLAGLATVSTDVGWADEVLEGGRLAPLVPAKDPGRMAEALDRLLADPAARAQAAESLKRRVEADYSKDRYMERLLEVYAAVLGEPRP